MYIIIEWSKKRKKCNVSIEAHVFVNLSSVSAYDVNVISESRLKRRLHVNRRTRRLTRIKARIHVKRSVHVCSVHATVNFSLYNIE